MYAQLDKSKGIKGRANAISVTHMTSKKNQGAGFVDKRAIQKMKRKDEGETLTQEEDAKIENQEEYYLGKWQPEAITGQSGRGSASAKMDENENNSPVCMQVQPHSEATAVEQDCNAAPLAARYHEQQDKGNLKKAVRLRRECSGLYTEHDAKTAKAQAHLPQDSTRAPTKGQANDEYQKRVMKKLEDNKKDRAHADEMQRQAAAARRRREEVAQLKMDGNYNECRRCPGRMTI